MGKIFVTLHPVYQHSLGKRSRLMTYYCGLSISSVTCSSVLKWTTCDSLEHVRTIGSNSETHRLVENISIWVGLTHYMCNLILQNKRLA